VQDISPEIARRLGIAQSGVIVTDVEAGSPASEVGIQPQDVIVRVNRVTISSVKDFDREMTKAAEKKSVSLLIKRGKSSFFVTLRSE
jgi:serine protease Do